MKLNIPCIVLFQILFVINVIIYIGLQYIHIYMYFIFIAIEQEYLVSPATVLLVQLLINTNS